MKTVETTPLVFGEKKRGQKAVKIFLGLGLLSGVLLLGFYTGEKIAGQSHSIPAHNADVIVCELSGGMVSKYLTNTGYTSFKLFKNGVSATSITLAGIAGTPASWNPEIFQFRKGAGQFIPSAKGDATFPGSSEPEVFSYHICDPDYDSGVTTTTPEPTTTTTTPFVPLSGNARTTRYWDCAKPGCSWPNKVRNDPVFACEKDGVTHADPREKSGAIDSRVANATSKGNSYVCNDNQPFTDPDDPNIAYGFVAFVSSLGTERSCCACVEITFLTEPVVGKKFIGQITNTGGLDVDAHFDIMIPGGGVGTWDGCGPQWDAWGGWGKRWGGLSENTCAQDLPPELVPGCEWRFNWFNGPKTNHDTTYREVECPKVLTDISGCVR